MFARRSFATCTRVLLNKKPSEGANEGAPKKISKTKHVKNDVQPKHEKIAAQPKEEFRNDQYSSPEYFQHNKYTYVDYIQTMANQRLPQLSNKIPFKP